MSSRRINNIEALSKWLGSLQIIEEASSKYKQMNTEISVVPILTTAATSENTQIGIPKNIILDPG